MKPRQTALLTRLGGGRPGRLQRTTRITLSVLLVLSHPLWAATIIVDETTCTLIDAIDAANTDSSVGGCAAGSGADTLELTTSVILTEVNHGYPTSPSGLPSVSTVITIEGGGATIERDAGAPPFRLFRVGGGTLTLNDVTLRNGSANFGGAVNNSAGGTLTLTYCTVSGNSASIKGGAFFNNGAFTLTNSTVSGNSASSSGGGIHNRNFFTLTNSTLSDNSASLGGGLASDGGSVTLDNSRVSDNSASSGGGGIAIFSWSAATLNNSTVSGNSGGGLVVYEGTATLTNSTMSGNSGRGIAVFDEGTATLTNSTVSGNSAGGIYLSYGAATLTNSIVGNSPSGSNCAVFFDSPFNFTDGGNNFSDDDTCGPGFASISPGVDFDTALADNGGPTQTHALLAGSVAIDAAGDCGLATDQRGVPRNDGACDSGSFEFTPPIPMSSPWSIALLGAGLLVALLVFLALRRRWATST